MGFIYGGLMPIQQDMISMKA